jgi:hypothetical protein
MVSERATGVSRCVARVAATGLAGLPDGAGRIDVETRPAASPLVEELAAWKAW